MTDKEEIIRTREPGKNIPCRTCKHKLPPCEIMGEKIERYTYGDCKVFESKPHGILWNGDKCELYTPE